MSGLISGEAVVLDLAPARVASRGLAFVIDAAVQATILVAAVVALSAVADGLGGDDALLAALGLIAVVAALVGYPLTLETLTRGRTLGKLALGLRVVRADGASVRFRHSLIRALWGVVELWLTTGVIAVIASLSSQDAQRLGDRFAGTLVVREPRAKAPPMRWTMPPRMAEWAATADLSRVDDRLALRVRGFLARATEFTAAARWTTAVGLADEALVRVSPAPPPGIHPEEFLTAVVAERQRRDLTVPAAASTPPPPPAPAPVAAPVREGPRPAETPPQQQTPEPTPSPQTAPPPGGFTPPG